MKSRIPFLYVTLLFVSCSGNKQISSEFNRYVDPFIGTTYTGHTFPGATYPLGMGTTWSSDRVYWLGLLCRISL